MTEMTAGTKTPKHLWIVGIVALLWNAVGCLDYLMKKTQNEAYMGQFTPEQLDFFYGYPAWATAGWAIAVWGGLVGTVLLLMRRKAAFVVYVVSFVGMLVSTVHSYLLSDGFQIMGGMGAAIFTVMIAVISIGLIVYAKNMIARAVLR